MTDKRKAFFYPLFYPVSFLSLFGLLATFSTPASAQTKYVTDRITLEIHQTSSSTSPLIEQVPSGTPLLILETDGAFSKVETPDEKIGWVEAAYLMTEKPARLLYTELNSKHKQSLALISDLKEKKNTVTQISDEEKKDVAWMQAELKKARDKAKNLESTLATKSLNSKASIEDKKNLEARIAELKKKLDEKIQENIDNITELNALTSRISNDDVFFEGSSDPGTGIPLLWFVLSIAVFMLLGGLAGATMLDAHNRRRHGGFRI